MSYGSNTSHYQHHHYLTQKHKAGIQKKQDAVPPEIALANDIFEKFVAASTFKSVLHHFRQICELLRIRSHNFSKFYPKLKSHISSWRAKAIWAKLDKRASHKWYSLGKACINNKILIIGAGPCGLRSAIEAQLLGAKVVVVEKRDRFSRNNVLHLWPFVIADLKALGAKKFYGKFCAGSIDHISIRQLQCMLLKIALVLGVEIFEGVTFDELLEPNVDSFMSVGWHGRFSPSSHPVNEYEFDVLIGADGKRNTLAGFKRKEFRGKLAIAITANFINKHSELEARVQEISGVAFIFNQKFFNDLYAATGIDLENIVYYKDDTHYFVMTAKKHSLINKGVILKDLSDTQELLHPSNVDKKALCEYAREAADFSTAYQLPHLNFAVNHYGKPDIAMFDFTSMFAAENACRVVEKKSFKLLQCLVGDSLLEPFWPTGSGCARGFLSSLDACWAIRSWSVLYDSPLSVIAERESIYRLLAQTTPENLAKDYSSYAIEPSSRYPTVNTRLLLPFQVRHFFESDVPQQIDDAANQFAEEVDSTLDLVNDSRKRKRRDSLVQAEVLLCWFQKQLSHVDHLVIDDFNSFKDGRILCTILHRYVPHAIQLEELDAMTTAQQLHRAFEVLQHEFHILPVMGVDSLLESNLDGNLDALALFIQIQVALKGQIPNNFANPRIKLHKGQSFSDHLNSEDFRIEHVDSSDDELYQRFDSEAASDAIKTSNETVNRKRDSSFMDDFGERKVCKSSTQSNSNEDFSTRLKGLEAKMQGRSGPAQKVLNKPKDMIRAIGKIEKTDWNLCAIEQKIKDNAKPVLNTDRREKVPSWGKENYADATASIEGRMRKNGENEEIILKYMDIDASLKRLETKLREGSTLETGLRGHNKVSSLASQLSTKLNRNKQKIENENKENWQLKQSRSMVMPIRGSDLCHICDTRVYLVERLSAENKLFHRQCFKCAHCDALLRLGNYVYDREGRYGGKFFCISHFGLPPQSKFRKKHDSISGTTGLIKTLSGTNINTTTSPVQKLVMKHKSDILSPASKTPTALGRGTTPERAEFENSMVEDSGDSDDYLSEDEMTDLNFGTSANELDDDSSISSSDEENCDAEASQKLSAAETRRLVDSWERLYRPVCMPGSMEGIASLSGSDHSSGHGIEGDESHIATEYDALEDDKDDDSDEGEHGRRALEMRRLELNINVNAPHAPDSDSSRTEVGSDDSCTEIDTDSEFEDDTGLKFPIPTIVIDESPKICLKSDEEKVENAILDSKSTLNEEKEKNYLGKFKNEQVSCDNKDEEKEENRFPKETYVSQKVECSSRELDANKSSEIKPLSYRSQMTDVVAAHRNQLRRNYLLGGPSSQPKKSASSADIGVKFKSFMDKISETQKKLNPAPEPSPSMQAFLNISNNNSKKSPVPLLNETWKSRTQGFLNLNEKSNSVDKNNEIEQEDSSESSDESDDEGKIISFTENKTDFKIKNSNIKNITNKSYVSKDALNEHNVSKNIFNEGNVSNVITKCKVSPPNNEGKNFESISSSIEKSVVGLKDEKVDCDSNVTKEKRSSVYEVSLEDERASVGCDLLLSGEKSSLNCELNVTDEKGSLDCEESENLNKSSDGLSFFAQCVKDVEVNDKEQCVEAINLNVKSIFCNLSDPSASYSNDNTPTTTASLCQNVDLDFEKLTEGTGDLNVTNDFERILKSDVKENSIAMRKKSVEENAQAIMKCDADKKIESATLLESKKEKCPDVKLGDNYLSKKVNNHGLESSLNTFGKFCDHEKNTINNQEHLEVPLARMASEESLEDNESEKCVMDNVKSCSVIDDSIEYADLSSCDELNTAFADKSNEPSCLDIENPQSSCDNVLFQKDGDIPNKKAALLPDLNTLSKTADSLLSSKSAARGRYEGYIQRFQDRMITPTIKNDESKCQISNVNAKTQRSNVNAKTQRSNVNAKNENKNVLDENDHDSGEVFKASAHSDSKNFFSDVKGFNNNNRSSDLKTAIDHSGVVNINRSSTQKERKVATPNINFSSSKPIEEKVPEQKNETKFTSSLSPDSQTSSQNTSSTSSDSFKNVKLKDGDVVKDMVMSRLKKRKEARKSLPLSPTSSSSVITSPIELSSPNSASKEVLNKERSLNVEIGVSRLNKELIDVNGTNAFQMYQIIDGQNCERTPSQKDNLYMNKSEIYKSTPLLYDERFLKRKPIEFELISKRTTSALPLYDNKLKIKDISQSSPHFYRKNLRSSENELRKSSETELINNLRSSEFELRNNHPRSSQNELHNDVQTNENELQNRRLSKNELHNDVQSNEDELQNNRSSKNELHNDVQSNENELNYKRGIEQIRNISQSVVSSDALKDPNGRLKRLIEERKRRSRENVREFSRSRDKEACLRECLEEYRQKQDERKRCSAPIFFQDDYLAPKLDDNTLLSAQAVITSPNRTTTRQVAELPFENKNKVSKKSNLVSPEKIEKQDSLSTIAQIKSLSGNFATPLKSSNTSPSLFTTTSSNQPKSSPEYQCSAAASKRPVKKSKDRLRRRSLIQVVSGMFSKTMDKIKSKDDSEIENSRTRFSLPQSSTVSSNPNTSPNSNTSPNPNTSQVSPNSNTSQVSPNSNTSSSIFSNVSPFLSQTISPKTSISTPSPSVREKLAMFKLSRFKDVKFKSQDEAKRTTVTLEERGAISLPTSPAKTVLSFLQYGSVKSDVKSYLGSTGATLSQKFGPTCVKEMSSGDENAAVLEQQGSSTQNEQKAAIRAAKQAKQKRLRMAQEIQREIEECEVKTRGLEERGIDVEKCLIGEMKDGVRDEESLAQEWFNLVREKNSLVRWQDELVIRARELELDDRHYRLEEEWRLKAASAEREKNREDIEKEGKILEEMLSILEQKETLAKLIREDRCRYLKEDRDLDMVNSAEKKASFSLAKE